MISVIDIPKLAAILIGEKAANLMLNSGAVCGQARYVRLSSST